MGSSTPLRRSGRPRIPTQRYGEPLDDSQIEGDASSAEPESEQRNSDRRDHAISSDPNPEVSVRGGNERQVRDLDAPEDEEYDEAITEESESALEEESGAEAKDFAFTPSKSITKDIAVKRTASGSLKAKQQTSRKTADGRADRPSTETRNRGLPPVPRLGTVGKVIRELAGTDEDDFKQLVDVLTRWSADPIAPSRAGLQATEEDQKREAERDECEQRARAWYHDHGGRAKMREAQATEAISPEHVAMYQPHRHAEHKVVMGPHWKQTLFNIPLQRPMHLVEAWKPARSTESEPTSTRERNGWIVNLGARVHGLAWAPHIAGESQYLAISLWKPEPSKNQSHTAFEPSLPYEACIQIWAFHTDDTDGSYQTLHPEKQPACVHEICTSWGMCVDMQWCPEPDRAAPKQTSPQEQAHLGLLAGVWADGYVRILDVRVPKQHDPSSVHVLYKSSAFAARPPRSICTSTGWISSTSLAAGCANGQVAVWDISAAILSSPPPRTSTSAASSSPSSPNPPPVFARQLHAGYILHLAPCLPSHPSHLVTVATDGYFRLTDLRCPRFDSVTALRHRLYPQTFGWSPLLRGVVAPDGHENTSFLHLRRFYNKIAGTPCDAQVAALACSPVHPCVLIGAVDGSAALHNLAARLCETRSMPKSQEVRWFRHEWMPERGVGSARWKEAAAAAVAERGGDAVEDSGDAADGSGRRGGGVESDGVEDGVEQSGDVDQGEGEAPSLRAGITRITEGYKPTTRGMRATVPAPAAKGKAKAASDERRTEAIFEEPSGITALAWNPNALCGGWAAAGTGSGLLRVEDLAV